MYHRIEDGPIRTGNRAVSHNGRSGVACPWLVRSILPASRRRIVIAVTHGYSPNEGTPGITVDGGAFFEELLRYHRMAGETVPGCRSARAPHGSIIARFLHGYASGIPAGGASGAPGPGARDGAEFGTSRFRAISGDLPIVAKCSLQCCTVLQSQAARLPVELRARSSTVREQADILRVLP